MSDWAVAPELAGCHAEKAITTGSSNSSLPSASLSNDRSMLHRQLAKPLGGLANVVASAWVWSFELLRDRLRIWTE
jgi:hypothetical protein